MLGVVPAAASRKAVRNNAGYGGRCACASWVPFTGTVHAGWKRVQRGITLSGPSQAHIAPPAGASLELVADLEAQVAVCVHQPRVAASAGVQTGVPSVPQPVGSLTYLAICCASGSSG